MAYASTSPAFSMSAPIAFEPIGQDIETSFIFARWHIGDYIRGTAGMDLEQEGCYMRFLMQLYSRGKAFPDDDKLMCRVMSLNMKVWRRVKQALIDLGKIWVYRGCLTNQRFEKERLRRAEEMQKRAAAQHARYAANRAETGHETGTNGVQNDFETISVGEKTNEINDPPPQAVLLPESINQNPKEEEKKEHTAQSDMFPAAEPPGARGPAFEDFWRRYPNKAGRARAQKLWSAMSAPNREKAIAALEPYSQCDKVRRGYVQQGDVFLSKRTWADFEVQSGAPGSPGLDSFRHAKATYGASQLPAPLLQRWLEENDIRRRKGEPLMRRPEELRDARVNPYHLRDVPGEAQVGEPADA